MGLLLQEDRLLTLQAILGVMLTIKHCSLLVTLKVNQSLRQVNQESGRCITVYASFTDLLAESFFDSNSVYLTYHVS